MTIDATVRRVGRRVLPRPLVEKLRTVAVGQQRRSNTRKLAHATASFEEAYGRYWDTGVVPEDAGELLFLATWASGGTYPRSRVPVYCAPYDPAPFDVFGDDVLHHLEPSTVARHLTEEGFYVAPDRLPDPIVDDILASVEAGPCQPRGDGLGPRSPGVPDQSAPTWWMQPGDSLKSGAVRRLIGQRRLAEIAGEYLGVDPVIMSVALWKSFAWSKPDRNSAQQFHYDNDRAAFLKMFVYLTDVGPLNGAHVYVPRSHREKPKELLHGDRLADQHVASFFPPEGWRTITGQRGTVFFADTAGFHKGGHVASGERAVFQVNVACDRFGIAERPIGVTGDAPDDLQPLLSAAPRYFGQLFTPEHPSP
jgi:hypothetical protein